MTEKDLDIAIEKCERIMEFDTRTLKDPVSENGWIFGMVYDLLKFLQELQFSTGAKDKDEPDPRWIPCSEKLPDKEGVYLVTDKSAFGEKISMRYWNIHEKDAFWSGYESDVVLAWMPLPVLPYQKGEQNDTTESQ